MRKILVDEFLLKMKPNQLDLWRLKHSKTANESLREWVVEYVGEAIHGALR